MCMCTHIYIYTHTHTYTYTYTHTRLIPRGSPGAAGAGRPVLLRPAR